MKRCWPRCGNIPTPWSWGLQILLQQPEYADRTAKLATDPYQQNQLGVILFARIKDCAASLTSKLPSTSIAI